MDTVTPSPGHRPLEGVRVVELASFFSGPLATMMLSDLGADVVKVEPPSGEPLRRLGRHPSGIHPLFVNANRGKSGIAVDLKTSVGRDRVLALVDDADIFVSNWRPVVAERLGLGDDTLAARNPNLIRLYITGFGEHGPLARSPAYDAILQARLGLTEAEGDGTTPALAKDFAIDKMSAMLAAQATLAALYNRAMTGVADRIDLAMLDAGAYGSFPDVMANRTMVGYQPPAARSTHADASRPLRTTDGWVVVMPVTGDQIRRSFAALGRADLADPVLASPDAPTTAVRFHDQFEPLAAARATVELLALLDSNDVPAAPCATLDEALADEQALRNDLFRIHAWPEWADVGPMRHVRYPARFASCDALHPTAGPPRLP